MAAFVFILPRLVVVVAMSGLVVVVVGNEHRRGSATTMTATIAGASQCAIAKYGSGR